MEEEKDKKVKPRRKRTNTRGSNRRNQPVALAPKSKNHPLESSNFLTRLIFWWISEMVHISKTVSWTQKMHYHQTKPENVKPHARRFITHFEKTKDLAGSIITLYRHHFIEVIVVMFFVAVYATSSAVLTATVIERIKNKVDLRDETVLRDMILSFLAIAFISSTSVIIRKFYIFRVDRFSCRIRAAVIATIQHKIMKFSVMTSNYFTEGNISNLLQVDSKRLMIFFSEYLILVDSLMTILVGTTYMGILAGWKVTGFVMGTFTIIYLFYGVFYYMRAKLTKSFLFFKDNRMAYFQNVLQNLEYVKMRSLENFYAVKLFEKRENEMRTQIKIVLIMSFGSLLDFIADGAATVSLLLFYTYFYDKPNPPSTVTFLAFYQILNTMKAPFYKFIFIINRIIEVLVSLRRISRFLAATEVGGNKYKELSPESDSALKIRNGSFRWKVDEDALINADQDKTNQVRARAKSQVRTISRATYQNALRNSRGGANQNIQNGLTGGNLTKQMQMTVERSQTDGTTNDLKLNLLDQQNVNLVQSILQDDEFKLRNANLDIKKGEKVVVFGESCSGKSSLLYALLGEMIPDDKNTVVYKSGSIGYLSQGRWLIGDTIEENITLGKDYDEEWMTECLESSQLVHDIANLNNGLDTMMGDTSDTVSGGQRARIALSRCFYHNPDIFILDDPCSSLDSKVTDKIMTNIRNNRHWRSKTFVISTNNIKMFDYADKVVFIKKGNIEFFGKYNDMMKVPHIRDKINELREAKGTLDQGAKEENSKNSDSQHKDSHLTQSRGEELDELNKFYGNGDDDNYLKPDGPAQMNRITAKNTTTKKDRPTWTTVKTSKALRDNYFLKEDKAKGSISWAVLNRTFKGSGGYLWFFFTYFVVPFSLIYGYYQLRYTSLDWGESFTEKGEKNNKEVREVGYWAIYISILGFLKRYCVFISLVWLGRSMHAKMVFRILHSKINEFMKRIPMGQIMNRFSNDIDVIDKEVGDYLFWLNYILPKCYLNLYSIVFGVQNPFMVFPPIIFLIIAFTMRTRYMAPKREITRLFQITTSPVIGLGSSCIIGGPVIRCIKNEAYLQDKMEDNINENTKNYIMDIGLDGWFTNNLALFDLFIVQIPSYALLLWTLYDKDFDSKEDFKKLTLFMLLIVDFATDLGEFLNYACMAEGKFVSVERCAKFEQIDPEPGYLSYKKDAAVFEQPKKNLKEAKAVLKKYRRQELFPRGLIELRNVSARYPTGTKDVVDDVSITFEPGEKIGIVGRTGAGKSTFIKLLWRGMEPYKGEIKIDGQDISKIDLKTFRDQITVISQQTNLFEGSIADNISPEPMSEQKIRETENILRRLKFPSKKLEIADLKFHLETDASNLSEGEKQIISYVRGVYNKRRIVILDEASAYVDNETEKGFKELAETEFGDSTVLIIAHRIQTVINCDKILVLGGGRVLEFDSPQDLLADSSSEFYQICKKA